MILRSLELGHFGPFSSGTWEFRRGMNLVHGPNEAGKSTLVSAVLATLFGSSDPEGVRTWGWEGPWRASLVLEGEGETVRLERDFGEGRLLLRRTDDLYRELSPFEAPSPEGEEGAPRETIAPELSRLLGFSSPDLFRALLVLGQGSLSPRFGEGVAPRLRALLGGYGGVDSEEVLSALEAEYLDLGAKGSQGGQIGALRDRLGELEELWQGKIEPLKELGEVRREAAELAASLGMDPGSATVHERGAGPLSPALRPPDPTRPASAVPEAGGLVGEARRTRERLLRLQREAAALRQDLIDHPGTPVLFPAVLTAVFLVLGAGLGLIRSDLWLGALGGAGFLSAFAWGVHLFLSGTKRGELRGMKERLGRLEIDREQTLARLESLDEQLRDEGLPISAAGLDALAGAPDVPPRGEGTSPKGGGGACAPGRGTLSPPAGGPLALSRLLERSEGLCAEVADLRRIELEGERLRALEQQLLRRRRVVATARELLSQATAEFGASHQDRFAAGLGRHLGRMTSGRHPEVRLDGDWSLHLRGSDRQWHPLEAFSRGTRDAAWIALRLSLIDLLGKGRTLFLLVDDSLASLDQARRDEALRLLEQVAARHQVILFSHEESLLKRAARSGWHMVVLNDQTPVPTRKPPPERSDNDRQLHLL